MKSLSEAEFKHLKELFDLAEEGFRAMERELVGHLNYVEAISHKSPDILKVKACHIVCDLIKEELSELYTSRKTRSNNWIEINQKYSEQRRKHGNVW